MGNCWVGGVRDGCFSVELGEGELERREDGSTEAEVFGDARAIGAAGNGNDSMLDADRGIRWPASRLYVGLL